MSQFYDRHYILVKLKTYILLCFFLFFLAYEKTIFQLSVIFKIQFCWQFFLTNVVFYKSAFGINYHQALNIFIV